jgi:hypothetical protein
MPMTADTSTMPAMPTRLARSALGVVQRDRLRSTAFVVLAALLAAGLAAPAANAEDAEYEGSAADGSVVIFTTTDPLVTGDTDSRRDVFERSKDAAAGGEYVTRVVSLGPTGGNQAHDANFAGASGDGTRIFFSTKESLVPGDADKSTDVYVRNLDANTTRLVSQGAATCVGTCGNGAVDASFVSGGVAAGGERAFFATVEKLSTQDTDSSSDIYMRDLGISPATTLVSQGAASCAGTGCGNGVSPAFFKQASSDGTKAFFTSAEGLVAGEGDGLIDVYERNLDSGTTTLVSSSGPCPGAANCNAVYGGAANDGSRVFFETTEQIAAGDTDSFADVYEWAGGPAILSSAGPDEGDDDNVTYAGNSADGSAVFFHTDERLVPLTDGDAVRDVYRHLGGVTTLISTGPVDDGAFPATFKWASPNGTSAAVIFTTAEPLTAADEDTSQDVYERDGATTTLLSVGDPSCGASDCGNGAFDADFDRASADGSHVFFVTDEPLVEDEPLVKGDSDENTDVYQRFSGATTLISTGPLNGNGPFDARIHGASQDGSLAFFVTEERLTAEDDFASEDDVYSRSPAGTLLVSVGNDPGLELGPEPPTLEATDPPSPGTSTEPSILGQADFGTEIKIYKTSNCSGEQASGPGGEAAGGGSEVLASPGIPVAVAAGSTTSFYATAEAEGIVSGCSGALTYKHTQEAPPPPPPTETGGGSSGSSGGGGTVSPGTPAKPKTHSGGIAYVTPETLITFGPSFKTRKRAAVFRFVDSTGQPGTSFFCKLDRRSWRSCGSPLKLKRLRPAKHVFRVKAINAVGAPEPSPVKHSFKVVR